MKSLFTSIVQNVFSRQIILSIKLIGAEFFSLVGEYFLGGRSSWRYHTDPDCLAKFIVPSLAAIALLAIFFIDRVPRGII
mgnify:CR=1 FL=1